MRILRALLGCLVVASLASRIRAQTIAWKTPQPSGTSRPFPFSLADGSKVLLGAHLDWDWDQPINLTRRSTLALNLYSIFLPFPLDDTAKLFINKTVETKPFPQGGIITITLEPSSEAAITSVVLNDGVSVPDVVAMVRYLNEHGVPVIVRFAHEMNGWWSTWAWRPSLYRTAFRTVALAIQACPTCNTTATMWAPQVASSFPWGVDVPLNDTEAFLVANPGYKNLNWTEVALLDSNGNGKIDFGDEPYEPFYPGDDVVDIVGMSIYYTGSAYFGEGALPYPEIFRNSIRGFNPLSNDTIVAPNFYDIYAAQRNKTFALAETSVMSMNPNDLGKTPGSPTWLQVKQGWWRQTIQAEVFDLFPQYRISYMFEFVKEDTLPGVTIDFGYTVDPHVAAAFVSDLPTSRIQLGTGQFISINAGTTPLTSPGAGAGDAPVSSGPAATYGGGGASTSTAAPGILDSPGVTSAPPNVAGAGAPATSTSASASASPTPTAAALSSNSQVAPVKGASGVGATPLGWEVTMVLALAMVVVVALV